MRSLLAFTTTNTCKYSRLALLALALPVAGFSTALQASGTGGSTTVCEFGVACPDPFNMSTSVGISPSPLSNAGTFNFIYTMANNDQYQVTGNWSASYATGTDVFFNPTVTFIGQVGNPAASSAGIDTLTLDLYQNFFDNTPGTWDGPPAACEYFGVDVAPLATATATLSYGGAPIGTINAGPGVSNQTLCSVLTITPPADTASFLAADFNMTFTFAEFTAPGTGTTVPPPPPSVPEPSSLAFALLGSSSGALFLVARRSRRQS